MTKTVGEVGNQLDICRLDRRGPELQISFNLTVREDLSWVVSVCGQQVGTEGFTLLSDAPTTIMSVRETRMLLEKVDQSKICTGKPSERFLPLSVSRKGVFKDPTGMYCQLI